MQNETPPHLAGRIAWGVVVSIAVALPIAVVTRTDLFFDDFYFLHSVRLQMESWTEWLVPQPAFHYRPLSTYVFFGAGNALSALEPWGYRVLLAAFLLLGAVAVYLLLRSRSLERARALGGALLFLVSLYWLPNATWFSNFQHTLYLVLFVLGLMCWVRFMAQGDARLAATGLGLLVLSFFSNQVALVFSVLWLVDPLSRRWILGTTPSRVQWSWIAGLALVQALLAVVFAATNEFVVLSDPASPYYASYSLRRIRSSVRYYHLLPLLALCIVLAGLWYRSRDSDVSPRTTLLDLVLGAATMLVGFAPFSVFGSRRDQHFLGLFFVGLVLVVLTLTRSWPRWRVNLLLAGILALMLPGYAEYAHYVRHPPGADARSLLAEFRALPMRTRSVVLSGLEVLAPEDRFYPLIWWSKLRLTDPRIEEVVIGEGFVWPGPEPSAAHRAGHFDAYGIVSTRAIVRDCDRGVGCDP